MKYIRNEKKKAISNLKQEDNNIVFINPLQKSLNV